MSLENIPMLGESLHGHGHDVQTGQDVSDPSRRQPLGDAADLEWAKTYVERMIGPGRSILAAVRWSPEAIKSMRYTSNCQPLMIPFIPVVFVLLTLSGKCFLPCTYSLKKHLESTVTILTSQEIFRVVRVYKRDCACLDCDSTNKYDKCEQAFPLVGLASASVETRGDGGCKLNECWSCVKPYNCVVLHGPAIRENHRVIGTGSNEVTWWHHPVSDPDLFAELINATIKQHHELLLPSSGVPHVIGSPLLNQPRYGTRADFKRPGVYGSFAQPVVPDGH